MVDGAGGRTLWTTVSLEDLTVDSHNLPLIERYSCIPYRTTVHSKTHSLSLSRAGRQIVGTVKLS